MSIHLRAGLDSLCLRVGTAETQPLHFSMMKVGYRQLLTVLDSRLGMLQILVEDERTRLSLLK